MQSRCLILLVGVGLYLSLVAHAEDYGDDEDPKTKWTKLRSLFLDLANNGLQQGETCKNTEQYSALEVMKDIAGKDADSLLKEFEGKGEADPRNYDNIKSALQSKDDVCAVMKNLMCDDSTVPSTCKLCPELHKYPALVNRCNNDVKSIISAEGGSIDPSGSGAAIKSPSSGTGGSSAAASKKSDEAKSGVEIFT